jgi:pimeloyl-ACP methyl ester carboxylesterase
MPLASIDGVRLMVDDVGSGAPLVLVHGSWADRRSWEAVQQQLARSFRTIAYDRRGHSDSGDGPTPGTRRGDEDDLAALLEALDAAPAHLVGNSFGASVTLSLAARRPELVTSVCAHEPPLLALAAEDPMVQQLAAPVGEVVALIDEGRHEEAARRFVDEIALGPGSWDALPEEVRAVLVGNAATFADEQRDPGWADLDLDALTAVSCPVLLTTGEGSPPFYMAVIERLTPALARGAVRTVPGGHVPQMTHPDPYAAVLLDFLSRLD